MQTVTIIKVAQVLETRKVISELSKARDEEQVKLDEQIRHLKWDIYYGKRNQLQREEDSAIEAVKSIRDKATAEKDADIQTHNSLIQQAKRILEILRLNETKPLTIGDDAVKVREYNTETMGESLGYLLDDDYLKVKLFIVANRKPVNKYSLIAVGRSIFGEPLIKYPYSYGTDINYSVRFSLLVQLRDAPTPDDLKDWLRKHKDTLLLETLEEYQRVKQEYLSTKLTYKTDDFRELILWTCPQCNNFQTIFDYLPRDSAPQCYHHEPCVSMTERRQNDRI